MHRGEHAKDARGGCGETRPELRQAPAAEVARDVGHQPRRIGVHEDHAGDAWRRVEEVQRAAWVFFKRIYGQVLTVSCGSAVTV